MVHEVIGDLLSSKCQYICHQTNCQSAMNSGVAKSIRKRWPKVFKEYSSLCQEAQENNFSLLGDIQLVKVEENQIVINMFAQEYYGYDGMRYTSYDAFWSTLGRIKTLVPKGSTIAFPYCIGSCRGGANWSVIRQMIISALGDEYAVFIYKLEE